MMRSVFARVEAEVQPTMDEEEEEEERLEAEETVSTTASVVVDEDVRDSPPNDELPESPEGEERDESSEEAIEGKRKLRSLGYHTVAKMIYIIVK